MEPEKPKLDGTADNVIRGVFNDHVLHSLTVMAVSTESAEQFVDALIRQFSSNGKQVEDAVLETMQILEELT